MERMIEFAVADGDWLSVEYRGPCAAIHVTQCGVRTTVRLDRDEARALITALTPVAEATP